jgi:tetratricopeptide (TPR) repeat protein
MGYIRAMRTTASYDLFPDVPSERAIARARWLAQQGRVGDAERAYRSVLATQPDLKACWAECFELLRRDGRALEALRLGEAALGHFGPTGFALTLQGAALIDLGRYREALGALEQALERDADLGMAWHELGYAAHRMGDANRALLALDRAFAIEPHTETLRLRGKILRDAGRYQAAEVSFEGAAQAAEHADQRAECEREILATRRYAFFAPRKPDELSAAQRWFAATGTVVLAPDPGPVPPSDEALVKAFVEVARDSGWRFGQVVAADAPLAPWSALADALDAPLVDRAAFDPAVCPLVVAPRPLPADAAWSALTAAVAAQGAGLVFVLEHPADAALGGGADIIGVLTDAGARRPRMPNTAHAIADAQIPAARCAGRRLRPT